MNLPLLDPHNDVVFKLLFTTSLPLLTDLINAVRGNDAPVTVLEILNPRIEAEHIRGKFIILDILAKDQSGNFLNIEMQVQQHEKWSQRSMYYLAKTLVGQLKSGAQYAALKPVIGIHLLGYELYREPEQAIWCFEMRDRIRPDISLGSELQLTLVELPKADRLIARQTRTSPADSALSAWITWFEHWKEENIMNQIAHPPVLEAMQRLKGLSADEESRRMAEARELALLTERIEIDAAEKRGEIRGEIRGETRGEARGITIGAAQAMETAVKRLMANGMTEASARAMLGLT